MQDKILVIRLGALGDLLLAAPAFQAIRAAHPQAHLVLLTGRAHVNFCKLMPWFDEILPDTRPKWWHGRQWLKTLSNMRLYRWQRVYDLQSKGRSHFYGLLSLGRWRQWVGGAFFSSFRRKLPAPPIHGQDYFKYTLAAANVAWPENADFSWLRADIAALNLPTPYCVLIPGCAPSRPYKRWPAERFAELAQHLQQLNQHVVVVGTKADAEAVEAINQKISGLIDLTDRTNLAQLGSIFSGAAAVFGNDTGPTHLSALVGAPTLMLLTKHSDIARSGLRGERGEGLQGLAEGGVAVADVLQSRTFLRLK